LELFGDMELHMDHFNHLEDRILENEKVLDSAMQTVEKLSAEQERRNSAINTNR